MACCGSVAIQGRRGARSRCRRWRLAAAHRLHHRARPSNETSQAGAAWVYVQQPVGNEAFTLCALVLGQSQNMIILNNAPLYCSSNSGKTWLQRPRLTVAVGNGKPDQFELPMAMLSNGALLAWDVRTISMMAGAEPELLTGHILGAIPTPFDPNNIPGGEFGVTIEGAVFWQPQDSANALCRCLHLQFGPRVERITA